MLHRPLARFSDHHLTLGCCAAQAVAHGRWMLIEDINLAPDEVLAALIPLLERRVLSIAARAETVQAAPGFQLFATVTSAPGEPRALVGAN